MDVNKAVKPSKKLVLTFLALLLLFFTFFFLKKVVFKKRVIVQNKTQSYNDLEEVKKVSSSVKVLFKKSHKKNTAILSVFNIPKGTDKVEYELSYKTQDKGIQGVIGKVSSLDFTDNSLQRSIFFGTCSSGKCIYHNIVGNISVVLNFNGTYGKRVFKKDFSI